MISKGKPIPNEKRIRMMSWVGRGPCREGDDFLSAAQGALITETKTGNLSGEFAKIAVALKVNK
jgi:hypothetical protein